MLNHILTASEQRILDLLPKPPPIAEVRPTNIWIIEWLSETERHTGKELHTWIKTWRPGWSIYNHCTTKKEVILSIEKATALSKQTGMIPILHLEAHGNKEGLSPSQSPQGEFLSWNELNIPFQHLNEATKCNLIVVMAACLGFAAIQALTKGPRSPAIALVGTDGTVNESNLLKGTKEFYRRFGDKNPSLFEVAESASLEICGANFEIEPFAILAYEVAIELFIVGKRPAQQKAKRERIYQLMKQETPFSDLEIRKRLDNVNELPDSMIMQEIWNYMFMIDLQPNNEKRFGLDWSKIEKQYKILK